MAQVNGFWCGYSGGEARRQASAISVSMEILEYERMHALENDYWWFVGRRAIIRRLLGVALSPRARSDASSLSTESAEILPPSLLDIGCGTGANLAMLRSVVGPNASIAAVDFSALALKFAREVNAAQSIALLRCDALGLPFGPSLFDALTMLDVLEHLSDDRAALSEVRRVLKPQGCFVFSVPAYQHLWSAHDESLHHFRRYELRGLRTLLRQSGFAVEKLSFAMSLMPPLAWGWRKLVLPFAPRRPRNARRHSEGAVLPQVPPQTNAALVKYLELEGALIARRPLRFGTSLVGIARRR